jgi:hypothetical protein
VISWGGTCHADGLGDRRFFLCGARERSRRCGGAGVMRRLGIILACAVGLIVLVAGGAVAWVKFVAYPDYSYRYRLTLAVEIDGKVHTGSSVIEVIWNGGIPFGDVGPYYPSIRGQAALVDLGPHGAVVAALVNGESYGPAADGALNAIWLASFAFGNKSTNKELPQLTHLTGKRHLTANNMPRLIWFSDISDPKTAKRLLVSQIPELFGRSARLVDATVEITRDTIVIDIDKKLPWYKKFADGQKAKGILSMPNEFHLSYPMFIGG